MKVVHFYGFFLLFGIDLISGSIVQFEKLSFRFYDINKVKSLDHLTCFTCDKSRSNEECNRKAIDETCEQKQMNMNLDNNNLLRSRIPKTTTSVSSPVAANYSCMTVHRFDAKRTLSIEKKCSTDCRPDMIGCVVETINTLGFNQQIQTCTYCCNKNYCNMNSAGSKEEAYNLGRTIIETSNSAAEQVNRHQIITVSLILLIRTAFFST